MSVSFAGLPDVSIESLTAFLQGQRWFAGKARAIAWVEVRSATPLTIEATAAICVLLDVTYTDGGRETYFVPLTVSAGDAGDSLAKQAPQLVVSRLNTADGPAVVHDALIDDAFCRGLLRMIENGAEATGHGGSLRGSRTTLFDKLSGDAKAREPIHTAGHDQSNSAVIFGERLFMKVFRKIEPGVNPDYEIVRYLTENANFDRFPRLAGGIDFEPTSGEPLTLVTLQEFTPNDGTAWQAMLSEVAAALQRAHPHPVAQISDESILESVVGPAGAAAELLGKRTAEMHRALAQPTADPAFQPEPVSTEDYRRLFARLREGADRVFQALGEAQSRLEAATAAQVADLLRIGPELVERFSSVLLADPAERKTRIHGDYHLGQVLAQSGDYIILDFEGEPARPIAERRLKDLRLRDVAGMLRSFGYAAYAGLFAVTEHKPEEFIALEPWAQAWQRAMSAAYLRGYYAAMEGTSLLPADLGKRQALLDFFIVEKALYEVMYELNNRPDWLPIPLSGVLAIA